MREGAAPHQDGDIAVVGGGIAGLTAALAFAANGRSVQVFERAQRLDEIGAGVQLSPNATRILDRLGVIDAMAGRFARPEAVTIRDARSLKTLAEVRLGDFAQQRWGAPYLVAARAALQSALLARVAEEPAIALTTGVEATDFDLDGPDHPHLEIRSGAETSTVTARLIVGADGVWSTLRQKGGPAGKSRFIGEVAWRATLAPGVDAPLRRLAADDRVTTFVAPRFHIVAYPLGDGALNLVVIAKGQLSGAEWNRAGEPERLAGLLSGADTALASLATTIPAWTIWPIHIADPNCGWTHPNGLALIGDAAHAMAPFAAQGAAMAIEDAYVLSRLVAASDDLAGALLRYNHLRRPRIRRVGLRGAFNHVAWHARGPVATARNLVLRTRSPERLAADFDWLYGFDAAAL